MTDLTFQLTHESQLSFAKIAGDFNPIHTDFLAARRLIFGDLVVHGVHILLYGLERFWPVDRGPVRITSLSAKFAQPVRVGEVAHFRLVQNEADSVVVWVTVEGRDCGRFECRFEGGKRGWSSPVLPRLESEECRRLTFEEVACAEGKLRLGYDVGGTGEMFPRLSSVLPAWQLAVVLASTRLVGMICPGERSIFSELSLRFRGNTNEASILCYKVRNADSRFNLIEIALTMAGMEGELIAFYRPAAVVQPAMDVVSRSVGVREFVNNRALIIGGSRGLGEVTAKIIAAGGGSVRLTYKTGADDAKRVVSEISRAGGDAGAFQFDVLASSPAIKISLGSDWRPSHLYYFPTPYIFLNKNYSFSRNHFRRYCEFYVEAFFDVFNSVLEISNGNLRVFFPSTSALEEMPIGASYVVAKVAGEVLCEYLQKIHKNVCIHVPRLPRLLTDKTLTVIPVETDDPVKIMLREIRILEAKSAPQHGERT